MEYIYMELILKYPSANDLSFVQALFYHLMYV